MKKKYTKILSRNNDQLKIAFENKHEYFVKMQTSASVIFPPYWRIFSGWWSVLEGSLILPIDILSSFGASTSSSFCIFSSSKCWVAKFYNLKIWYFRIYKFSNSHISPSSFPVFKANDKFNIFPDKSMLSTYKTQKKTIR